MRIITYIYRGPIEVPNRRKLVRGWQLSYRRTAGYSEDVGEGETTYPWLTRKQCREEAKDQGARAKFKMKP